MIILDYFNSNEIDSILKIGWGQDKRPKEDQSQPKKMMVTYSRSEAREKISQTQEPRKYSETREDSRNM